MIKFYQTLTNKRGDALAGYRLQVVDSDGASVPIYADASGTAFPGSVNYATADSEGLVEFYWEPASGQVLQTLDPTGDLIKSVSDFADAMAGAGAKFTQAGTGAIETAVEDELQKTVRTSQYTTFAQAAAAAVLADVTLLVDADRSLSADTTTTARLQPGGGLITTGTYNLTVAGIDGPEIPLFDKAGSGTITISSNEDSYLGWFSPTANGVADDTNPVTRWVESSANRKTGLHATIVTDTVSVRTLNFARSSLIGAGMNATVFKSLSDDDIFLFEGFDILGIPYVNMVVCGDFSCNGPGTGAGNGYGVRVDAGAIVGKTGYNNLFYNIDSSGMGGGTFKDEVGLFSSVWSGLRGGECFGHIFDMLGSGPDSIMFNCYGRDPKAGKAIFRVIYGALRICYGNGPNHGTPALGFWGIFGASTSAITINVTGGSVTIPAHPTLNVSSNTSIEHSNIEAFPDIAILAINGTVRIDEGTVFQTAEDQADCIAIYCTDALGQGYQGTLPPINNFVLVGTATWAQGCPVWVEGITPAFQPPSRSVGEYLNVRNFSAGVTMRLSASGTSYAGTASSGQVEQFARFRGLSLDMLRVTPQTPSSAGATGVTGEIAVDANYVYVCTATNTWKRAALATW